MITTTPNNQRLMERMGDEACEAWELRHQANLTIQRVFGLQECCPECGCEDFVLRIMGQSDEQFPIRECDACGDQSGDGAWTPDIEENDTLMHHCKGAVAMLGVGPMDRYRQALHEWVALHQWGQAPILDAMHGYPSGERRIIAHNFIYATLPPEAHYQAILVVAESLDKNARDAQVSQ